DRLTIRQMFGNIMGEDFDDVVAAWRADTPGPGDAAALPLSRWRCEVPLLEPVGADRFLATETPICRNPSDLKSFFQPTQYNVTLPTPQLYGLRMHHVVWPGIAMAELAGCNVDAPSVHATAPNIDSWSFEIAQFPAGRYSVETRVDRSDGEDP